ncbi:hypothetical protein O181_097432 [Austropuccinia psidii MF-1]|uniref:Integrase catalytic domain-containing protein n=1 Tax=Austropuccinia psidii MF-1 TaxID=1389203 RepID=A0A9Q3J992_9BASI|nr:hypothetical protein [Austropuccinia psidii MF-1]
MPLNRETFKSKTIHYCSNGHHNPLASHPPEKCWKLRPKKCLERYQRDAKPNYTFAQALLTIDRTLRQGDVLNVVLETGASDHMFTTKVFFHLSTKQKTPPSPQAVIPPLSRQNLLTEMGYTTTKLLKQREETFSAFKEYKTWAENLHQRKIVKIVSDGGGEFINNGFKKYAKIEGIDHSISPPYTPEHNGVEERGNSSVLKKARCLMQQTKLADQFWAEAMYTATFLLNMAPKRDRISPYKKVVQPKAAGGKPQDVWMQGLGENSSNQRTIQV